MIRILHLVAAIFAAYLIGSIPFGYLAGRVLKGVDIRKHGSGNVGATNVFRVVGKLPGIAVLLLDILKGYIAVTILVVLFSRANLPVGENTFKILFGLACVLGHNWTIFLKFKGGKGVAATVGVLIGLAPAAIAAWAVIWFLVFIATRYVSLSSLAASVLAPLCALLFKEPKESVILITALSILIIYRHRSNIKRLLKGEEPKLSLSGKK